MVSKSAMVFVVGKVTFVDLLVPYFGSMLNGKVSKMSSLIAEAFKLVPFPNLDHSKQIHVT